MLTSDHSIVQYAAGRALSDRLTRRTHAHYIAYAGRMIAVYRGGVGRTRRELHQSVGNVLAAEPDCDHRRVGAFCKLLDDGGEFDEDRRGAAAKLRLEVFAAAARFHPLVTEADQIFQRTESEAKRLVAAEVGRTGVRGDARARLSSGLELRAKVTRPLPDRGPPSACAGRG